METLLSIFLFVMPILFLILIVYYSSVRTKRLSDWLPSVKNSRPHFYYSYLFFCATHLTLVGIFVSYSLSLNPLLIIAITSTLLFTPFVFIYSGTSVTFIVIVYTLLCISIYLTIISLFVVSYSVHNKFTKKKKRKQIVYFMKPPTQ